MAARRRRTLGTVSGSRPGPRFRRRRPPLRVGRCPAGPASRRRSSRIRGGRSASCHSSSVGSTGFTAFHAAVVPGRAAAALGHRRPVQFERGDGGGELDPDVGRHQVVWSRLGHEITLRKRTALPTRAFRPFLTLPSRSASWRARSASARAQRNWLGCQPRGTSIGISLLGTAGDAAVTWRIFSNRLFYRVCTKF